MGSTPIFCTLNFGPDDLNAGPFFLFKKDGDCVNGDGVSMGTVLYDTFFNKNVSYRTVPIDTPSPLTQTPVLVSLLYAVKIRHRRIILTIIKHTVFTVKISILRIALKIHPRTVKDDCSVFLLQAHIACWNRPVDI